MTPSSFYAKWRSELPSVAASLTTALIIFLASTVAYKFRAILYPPFEALDYPLICRTEAVADVERGTFTTEIYVINTSATRYTEVELMKLLRDQAKGTSETLSTTIALRPDREFKAIVSALPDENFNARKGELVVSPGDGNTVDVVVRTIGARAILKAIIVVTGLPQLEGVNRAAKSDIPFDTEPVERACYSR